MDIYEQAKEFANKYLETAGRRRFFKTFGS